jgi:hypothetical protein
LMRSRHAACCAALILRVEDLWGLRAPQLKLHVISVLKEGTQQTVEFFLRCVRRRKILLRPVQPLFR